MKKIKQKDKLGKTKNGIMLKREDTATAEDEKEREEEEERAGKLN